MRVRRSFGWGHGVAEGCSLLTPLLASLLVLGCTGETSASQTSPTPTIPGVVLSTLPMDLDPQIAPGQETYQCLLFDASALQGAAVHALRWTPPDGALHLHHAMLFATSASGAPGAVPCEPMPSPVAVLPLYAPGGETTELAEGVSIVVPANARNIYVELHLLRLNVGSASASIDLLASRRAPTHLAGWVDDPAPVPDLAPHAVSTSVAQCKLGGAVHVVGSWPHMHRLGAHFESTIVRANAGRELLVDVASWDFIQQPLYTVDASLGDGDAIETACTWNNTTGQTVQPGPLSSNEMCNQGLVVWPPDLAHCVP